MRITVGMLAATLALLIALPGPGLADDNHPRKYGVEFQIGGGYSMMQDVNDFIPHTRMTGITPTDEINIGAQFGVGILYRHLDDFGWQFGYNRFAFLTNYRIGTYFTSDESWAEQSLTGGELYAMPTWYKGFSFGEMFFGVGPAIYFANMDRSIDLVIDPGSHLTDGGFSDAKGKALGLTGVLGLELDLSEMMGLALEVGGRNAVVGTLKYTDQAGVEQIVYLDPYLAGVNPSASYPKLTVDYSGFFAKATLRAYFQPSGTWRHPKH